MLDCRQRGDAGLASVIGACERLGDLSAPPWRADHRRVWDELGLVLPVEVGVREPSSR
jgi:hypothetical protein